MIVYRPKWVFCHHEGLWWVCLKDLGGGMSFGRTRNEAKARYLIEYHKLIQSYRRSKHEFAERWWEVDLEYD